MKHFFTFLSVVVLFAVYIPTAMAYNFSSVAPSGQTLYYNIVDGNAWVTTKNTSSPYYTTYPTGDLTIPSTVTHNGTTYSVTSIGDHAFSSCNELTSVTIPNSVTSIGDYAFSGCSGLTGSLTIPNSVTSIGERAFCNCSSLTSVTIPNSVTSIGWYAFAGCTGLTSVTIGDSVTSIGEGTFHDCSGLTSLTIGNSVTSIDEQAFRNCSSLTSLTIPNSVTFIGLSAFFGCSSLTSVIIGNSVTRIGSYAFYHCSGLTSLTIPNSVTSIGSYAFLGCSGLTSLTIGNSVTSIGEMAFRNCSGLTSLTIPNSVTTIDQYAFYYCSGLTSVTIGNSVTSIGDAAFCNCSGLTSVYYTGDVAGWCGIEYGGYSANPLYHAHNLYINNSLVTNLVIPNSVTKIKHFAFYHATCLTSVTIGSDTIDYAAFSGCSGLTSVTIIGSDTIGGSAFHGCSGITEIHSLNTTPPSLYRYYDSWSFDDVPTNIPVYIPCGSLSAYADDNCWTLFTNFIEESDVTISVVSDNISMGSVQVVTSPSCNSPQAVVQAIPNNGYRFDHWSDGSTQNPHTLTVNSDMELIGYFESLPTYTITANVDAQEMGSVSGGGTYYEGAQVVLTATPNEGYRFTHWNDGNTQNPRTITVISDATYTAYFEVTPMHTITVVSADTEMGAVGGSGTYYEGSMVTITAIANDGYRFLHWNDGNTQAYRAITVTGDATYTAYFRTATEGIDDVETTDNIKIYTRGNRIVIDFSGQQAAVSRQSVVVYDVMGRVIKQTADSGQQAAIEIPVTSAGVYMVKVGDQPSRKVLVRP